VTARGKKTAWVALWIALAIPALWQLGLLARAIGGRFLYPYDLEWMEGGLLQHAQRIADGQGLYVAPSIDFIPYLYTPLYPGLISLLGSVFGISYQLGRALSILALLGITAVTIAAIVRWRPRILARFAIVPNSSATAADGAGRGPRWVGAALALGVFAAGYPYVEGWYDLVRADTLFLFLITAGVLAASRWARAGIAGNGDALMMAAGALMTLAFFTKQTGVIYVLWCGVIIVAGWVPDFAPPGRGRRVMLYAAIGTAVAIIGGIAVGLATGAWSRGALAGVAAFVLGNGTMLAIAGRRPAVGGALRRILVYGLTAAVIGLGGVLMLDRVTHHWFWIYTFKIHQAHDFGMHRFWESFGHILWHWPALTISIGVTLVAVIATAIWRPASPGRRLPTGGSAFLLWTATYAVSTIVGAIGYGTEFAHFNAFMPALLHGALAFGAAVPALAGCARAWTGDRPEARHAPTVAAVAVALAGGITLIKGTWDPTRYIPRDADEAAGAALIKRISSIEGDVWIPSHPWYAHLAGKRMFAHRMGIKDVTARKPRPVIGLDTALRGHRFAAIVLDQRDVHQEVPGFMSAYRTDVALPGRERPRVYTGAPVMPEAVWIPAIKEQAPFGVRVLFDFETGRFDGWEIQGDAWGRAAANGAVTGQAVVGGFGGRFFATSMRGGEKATGTLVSQPFVIDGSKITLRVGGGISDDLRIELRVDGRMVRRAVAASPVGERLTEITWDVAELRDQTARIAAVDNNATNSWAHLNFDEVWLWP
jgi:hypothetical protein